MTLEMVPRIRIEVPSGGAALLLEDRMRSLQRDARACWDGTRWWLELAVDDGNLDDAVAIVREWFDEEPLGAGYDGPALDHEP